MDQKSQKCPHCEESNYPMVEFCRHCGESLHSSAPPTGSSLLIKWIHHAIDAMFWIVDETVRWWEIGKLGIHLKTLRRDRSQLLKEFEEEDDSGGETSSVKKQELMGVTEELARLSGREEFLRNKCWAMTPELAFVAFFVIFIAGVFFLKPGKTMLPRKAIESQIFTGHVVRASEIPIGGQNVICSAAWFDKKLYIGGDGGLIRVDVGTSVASSVADLPAAFFVRDLVVDRDRLLIAGYSGIYEMAQTIVRPYYHENQLPVDLVNSIAVAEDGKLMIGTVAHGVLKGNESSAVFVAGTRGLTVKDFGSLAGELWIMHENGIIKGRGENYSDLSLQVLAGRHLRSMVTTEKSVFVGTDQGVVAGYKNSKNWVWTLISAGRPGKVNDLKMIGEVLFIASEEGTFRFYKGKVERLASLPAKALAIGDGFLASIGKNSVVVFNFSGGSGAVSNHFFADIPEVGSFTPSMPIVTMTPVPQLQLGRLPNFRINEQNQISIANTTKVDKKASMIKDAFGNDLMISLPADLQKPVFSDLLKVNESFYLATINRGVWNFKNNKWVQVDGIPTLGLEHLSCYADTCFAYGNGRGAFAISGSNSQKMMGNSETSGLTDLTAIATDTVLLLFKNGEIKNFKLGAGEQFITRVPEEFSGQFHSVWKIDNQLVVIVDKGVLVQESKDRWNMVFFRGRLEKSAVSAVEKGESENLYIALVDGRIFEYKLGKVELIGSLNEQPVALNFAGYLWVAGKSSLFFFEKDRFFSAPYHENEQVLGAYPADDNSSVLVFTGSGLRVMAGRSGN